jgi:hypothetical protein
MIPYLACDTARVLLEPFLDGELPTADQVALEAHLRWCRTCSAHVEDMSLIGWGVRVGTPKINPEAGDAKALMVIQSGVLARIRAERAQSLRTRVAEMFTDMRLLWPAMGASAAVILCLCGAMNVWRLATERRPDSLAAMIETLAHRGSDSNPLGLESTTAIPRVVDEGFSIDRISGDDVAYALSAVVTREGRVGQIELIDSPRTAGAASQTAAQVADMTAVLNAARESRFQPAQARGGHAVAVEFVWVIEKTTAVLKEPSRRFEEALPAVRPVTPAVPSKNAPVPSGVRSSVDNALTAA